MPLSSSLRQSEADQEIFSETVDSLNNATKPTFDGSADEWENYLASRKLDPDDDSENDFPNTIEDANKKIQIKMRLNHLSKIDIMLPEQKLSPCNVCT